MHSRFTDTKYLNASDKITLTEISTRMWGLRSGIFHSDLFKIYSTIRVCTNLTWGQKVQCKFPVLGTASYINADADQGNKDFRHYWKTLDRPTLSAGVQGIFQNIKTA